MGRQGKDLEKYTTHTAPPRNETEQKKNEITKYITSSKNILESMDVCAPGTKGRRVVGINSLVAERMAGWEKNGFGRSAHTQGEKSANRRDRCVAERDDDGCK